MAGEASLSPSPSPPSPRQAPPLAGRRGDGLPKRPRHHHHHHRRHRRRHRHGDKDDVEEDEVVEAEVASVAAAVAQPADDEVEEGEILDDGGDSAMDAGRGSDAEHGKAEPVSGASAPAPEYFGNHAGINSKVDLNMSHAYQLASDSSWKDDDFSTKEQKSDRSAHETESDVIFLGDGENNKRDESSQRTTKSPRSKREKGRKQRDVEVDDTKARARLRSPVSEKGFYVAEHRRDDEHHTTSSKDSHLKNQSRISPNSRHHGEARRRDRSRSRETKREPGSQVNGSRAGMRDDSDHESDDRYGKLDKHTNRIFESERLSYKERERSCDRRGDRHDSREKYRDEKRHSNSAVDRERVDLHEVSRRERERSSSYSRSDRRESVHRGHDERREREMRSSITRHKDDERRRDTSRDRYKETDKVDSGREREKFGDDRDRGRYRDKEMDARRAREGRDRVSSNDRRRDSTHSKYSTSDGHKGRSRSGEKGREADHRSRRSEEMKENSFMEEDEEDYQEKIEQQLAKQEEDDPEKIKEEARKRKEAILEKYRQKQLEQQQQQQQLASVPSSNNKGIGSMGRDATAELKVDNSNNVMPNEEVENKQDSSDIFVGEPSFAVGKSPTQGDTSASADAVGNERATGVSGLGEGTPKSERSADMFCDDIFGESPTGVRKLGKEDGLHIEKNALHDNWDDPEGYYTYRFGEVLDGRYEITAAHGKGVFSTVVRAKDLKAGKDDPEEVAIKIIRNNETMYKAGKQEVTILEKLASADREDRRHCVRFISSFMYRNHLCLVFESLNMNLREVLKKFGRNIGLKLTAVRTYSKQLFIALKHLKNCKVLHCDIKPDNMLVNEAKNVLKLCDFGNAMFAGMNEVTPYLVSRFYRAPEIILGLPYDHPLDMWSVGCCLYELYTGKVLFPGPSNNDMLRLHMELKGPFPKKMLRKGAFTLQHFDQDLNFHATEEDPVTKKPVKRLLLNIKPKDIGSLISSFPGEDPKMQSNFKDLLEKIFVLDPEKRITVSQALSHPFITGK